MMTRRQALKLASGMAVSVGAVAAAWDVLAQRQQQSQPEPGRTGTTRFGAATYTDELFGDAGYRAFYARHVQVVVPDYFLKWESVQPRRGQYDWGNADASVDFGRTLNCAVRGHTLVWHESMPAWALEISNAADAERQLVTHIETIVARYKGRISSWDVVNEALDEKASLSSDLRRSVWYRHLGERYIEVAFRTAAAVDPDCQLVLNDYGIETATAADKAKRNAYRSLLRRLRDKGVPMHAVGIQGHIDAANAIDRDGLAGFIAECRAMGLATLVTELDMMDGRLPAEVTVRDLLTAARTYELLHAVFSAARPTEIVTWGLSDRRTWLTNSYHKRADKLPNRPLPFDADLQPKPMWRIIEHFLGAPP